MKKIYASILPILLILFLTVIPTKCFSRDYIIYSIGLKLPMGEKNETRQKNYYVNLGQTQGVSLNTTLDVYRVISRLDPYQANKRYNYKVKIGQLKVIHVESQAAIGILKKRDKNDVLYELDDFIIGDHVDVHVQ